MRFGAALGTALQARRARRREPRERAGLPDDQARDHLGPQLDRRPGRRPAHAAGAGRQAPAEDAGLRRGVPRRRVDHRPRGGADPPLRAARASRSRSALQKEVEKHFTRQELRRVPFGEVGDDHAIRRARARAMPSDLLADLDVAAIRARGFRIVVDYGYSAGSYVLPLVLGPLGVEAITAHAFESDSASRRRCACARRSSRRGGSCPRSTPTSAPSSTARPSGST